MTLWFVGMTSKEVFFAGLDPPLSSCQRMGPVRSNRGIFTALSAAGRRNGRWSACLVPRLIVESWQGVSIEPLKLAPNWGSIKQCPPGSLVGCPGPWRRTKVEPNVGSLADTAPMASLSLQSSSFHASAPLSPSEKNKVEAICQGEC